MKAISPLDPGTSAATLTRASTATYWDSTGTLQTAAVNIARFGYTRDGSLLGLLVEPAATNVLWNNATLSTQTRTVSNGTQYTLSFYGTGSVTLSGAATGTTSGTGATTRVTRTFTTTSTSLTLTVSGSVTYAQLETGLDATSVIVTAGASASRSADVVTGTGVLLSDFSEATANYAGGTTYALGATVRYNTRLYESLQAANTGNTPGSSPTWWLDIGPDNVYAMFDRSSSKQSVAGASVAAVAVIMPANCNAAGLMSLADITTARLVVGNGYSTFYSTSDATTPVNMVLQVAGAGTIVSVLVRNDTVGPPTPGYPRIGQLVIGTMQDVGDTKYGLGLQLVDYSVKTLDEFGNYTFTERAYSKRVSAPVWITKPTLTEKLVKLAALRAVPTAWIFSDVSEYSAVAMVFGYMRDLSLAIDYPTHALYQLQVEGLA